MTTIKVKDGVEVKIGDGEMWLSIIPPFEGYETRTVHLFPKEALDLIDALNRIVELVKERELPDKFVVRCKDCGTPYSEMGLDIVLSDEQWLEIHLEGMGGILCGSCIAKRAEIMTKGTVIKARIKK